MSKQKSAEEARSLTQERLKEVVSYCPHTGVFVRISGRADYIGKTIGRPISRHARYLVAWIDGGRYRLHNLAWLYMHGSWPIGEIDHINRNRTDNRIANLRDVSRAENMRNRESWRLPQSRCNARDTLGVTKRRNKYRAQITVGGRCRYLGSYATPEEATAAYWRARDALPS